jgi:hypothetical protein
MPSVFAKLNLKDHTEVVIANAPASFEPELERLKDVTVLRDPRQPKTISFALTFVVKQQELDALSKLLAAKAQGDAVLWFAYPKGTSKRYQCEFNLD